MADNHISTGVAVLQDSSLNHVLPVLSFFFFILSITIFRRLDFPIINNELDLELQLRGNACLIKDAAVHASQLNVTNTELYLPIVELPRRLQKEVSTFWSPSHTKTLTCDHIGCVCLYGYADHI